MFQVGLNPYGLAYTVGLQASGTPGANPQPLGLEGFVALARELGVACIELDWRWIEPLSDAELQRVRGWLDGMIPVYSYWLAQQPDDSLVETIRRASALGAKVLRLHLTPVLEGARGQAGPRWQEMLDHARRVLRRDAPAAADAALIVGIENHQDLGSEELLACAEELGAHAGLVFDTGNPFAVGEDPLAFARRAAHRIRHVHLKDYVGQFTDDGFRLVRCAIGDGCVPFQEIAAVLSRHHSSMTASIEPGALDARHVRLFTPDWWDGYPPRDARELGTLLGRLRKNALPDQADFRTPWETGASAAQLVAYEVEQMQRSVDNLRAFGWIPG